MDNMQKSMFKYLKFTIMLNTTQIIHIFRTTIKIIRSDSERIGIYHPQYNKSTMHVTINDEERYEITIRKMF